MRTGSSDTLFQGHRGRTRRDARLKSGRKSRFRRLDLEGLENRLLLATAPAAVDTTVNGSALGPISLTNLTLATEQGDANSPTVAVDPYDSQKVFAVWGLDGSQIVPAVTAPTAVVEGAYSDDGGADWTSLGVNVNPPMTDPLTLTSYEQITDPSVAFDSQGNVYVLALQSSGATDGALTLTKFNFSGTSPNSVGLPNNGIIYQWITGADAATTPTLAVDAGTFPSGQTPPAGVPTDPYVNNVYIAWASIDGEPAAGAVVFNPDRIEIVVGTPVPGASGNQSTMAFSGVRTVNTGGNFTTQIDTHPQLIINPGNSGDPGQITVGWEDAGTADAANGGNPPLTLLMSNIVQPGKAYGFISGSIGAIAPAQSLTINGTTVTVPVTTPFSDSVSVPNPASINDLTVTLAATDQQSIGNLQVVLEAPNGAEITLVENQINAAAQANTSVGLPTGNAIGVYGFTTGATGNPGQVVGTTFDDNATRNIFDPTNAIPPVNGNTAVDYVGFFRPEFGSLKNFLTSVGSANINNSWTLLITNYSPTITAGVANQATLSAFSLQFSTRMTTPAGVSPSSIANEFEYYYGTNTAPFFTIVVPGSLTDTYPTTAPSTPNGVGPGLVFAEDNTLGPYSPYQGRIYAAFVGYFDAAISGPTNPTTNTDIFLVYSDNGGQTWSSPELVNADQASTDGYSAANDSEADPNNELTGRTQFQPELAVDQFDGDPGYLVARCARRRRQCPGRNLHHHQHRRRPNLRSRDLRQPAQDGRRRDHRGDQHHRSGVRQRVGGEPRHRRLVRLWQPDGLGRCRRTALSDLGGQLQRPQWRHQRQLLQRRSHLLPAEHLVPADDHRGRAADHLHHDGTGGGDHADRIGRRSAPVHPAYLPCICPLRRCVRPGGARFAGGDSRVGQPWHRGQLARGGTENYQSE